MIAPDARVVEQDLGDTLRFDITVLGEDGVPIDPSGITAAEFLLAPVAGGNTLRKTPALPDPAVPTWVVAVPEAENGTIQAGVYDCKLRLTDQYGVHTVRKVRLVLVASAL